MKMLVLMEIDVSKTVAETIQRTGFELVPDGTCMRVKVPNSPGVPQRKTKVAFVVNSKHAVKDIAAMLAEEPVASVEAATIS